MTAKEYLNQYRTAWYRAEHLREEYDALQAEIDRIRSPLEGDGIHTREISKTVEVYAVRLADKAIQVKRAELDAVRIRMEIYDVIDAVPGEAGAVLYERYIQMKTWSEVARAVRYSKRSVFRIHTDGLKQVEGMLEA